MYREVRGRNAQGGMEKCTVVGWSSSCTCVPDSQTQWHADYKDRCCPPNYGTNSEATTYTYNASLV